MVESMQSPESRFRCYRFLLILSFALSADLVFSAVVLAQTNDSRLNPQFDQRLDDARAKLEQERLSALSDKQKLLSQQLSLYRTKLNEDIKALPRYKGTDNSSFIDALKEDTQSRIDSANAVFQRESKEINDLYAQKQANILSSGNNLRDLMVSQRGSNKVVSNGTSLYVRNYINYGGVDNQPVRPMIWPGGQ